MSTLRSDPLLRSTKLFLRFIQGIAILAGIAIVAAIPLIWYFGDHVLAEMAKQGSHLPGNEALAAITAILAGCLILLTLAFLLLRHLSALIDTVDQGSPFIPENAKRLRTMGWLVLAMQGLAFLALPFASWLHHALPHGEVKFSVDLTGILTAMLLFILARVFDRGTQLEADIEGTV